MKKSLLLIILLIANMISFYSCKSTKASRFKNELLNNYFDKIEINQLKDLQNYFDGIINTVIGSKENDQSRNYELFYEKLLACTTITERQQILNHFSQDEIFECLDDELIDKIWATTINESKEPEISSLNYTGTYMEFLKALAAEDSLLYNYYNSIVVAGDISPSSYQLYFLIQKQMDLNSMDDKIICTIHYLSLCSPLLMREK